MAKRPLTEAELAQRRAAAKLGGRPKKDHGYRAARRAVEEARRLGKAAQPAAVRNLIAGMNGQLPRETADTIVACSVQLLNRFGSPAMLRTEEIGKGAGDTHFHLGIPDGAFPPAPASRSSDEESDDNAGGRRP